MRRALVAVLSLALAASIGCGKPPALPARFVSTAEIRGFDPVDSGDVYSSGADGVVYGLPGRSSVCGIA